MVKLLFAILNSSCGRGRLLTAMQSFTILQTSSGSRRLISSSRVFTILHTSRGRGRLLLAMQCFTILQTSSGRMRLLRATQIFGKADHDERARFGCKFFSNMFILCGRRVLIAIQLFAILHTSSWRRRLHTEPQFFTILHTFLERRRVIQGTQLFTTADFGAITLIHQMIFAGILIGEVAHLGPRLRRRGPRSADARLARRSRRGSAGDIVESTLESCENGLQMLHLNMRCYL